MVARRADGAIYRVRETARNGSGVAGVTAFPGGRPGVFWVADTLPRAMSNLGHGITY